MSKLPTQINCFIWGQATATQMSSNTLHNRKMNFYTVVLHAPIKVRPLIEYTKGNL